MKEQTLLKEQTELLTEIGDYLRRLRQHEELSLEDVASITLIPVRTLSAIEDGDLNRLPEPVYVQGFIKRYADAIGMDGSEFANAFPTGVHSKPSKPSWRGTIEAQLRPFHLYLLYTLLVLGAVGGLSYLMNRSTNQLPRYASTPQSLAGQPVPQPLGEFYGPPTPAQAASNSPKAKAAIASPISDKPVRVSLTVKGQQSWLRIVVDGKTEFEGMLSQGAQRSWVANEQVTVRAGDAGAVEISYNESQPQPLGQPGDVQEKTFGKTSQASLNAIDDSPNEAAISQVF
ncbi:MAG: helix-turn-helix domain-containing protein [Oscillatoriales cyanobacterium C42_A2020_001]|nr:helix-turn-helix domain-containing protein [Leptolyngbyaceae cyanobacterium C42_A2020_001]